MRSKSRLNIFLKAGSVSLALILCMQYLWVHREESRRPLSAPFLEYWSLHPLQRIEFYPSRILLEQKENRWIVYLDSREYPPNLNRLERFLSVTSNLKLTARDQATPIMLSRYGFTEADFARVTFYSSGKARTFLLGGPGPKGSEEYCLPEGEGVIYKLSDSLSYYAHQPLSYWIRLQLFDPPLQESNISAVGIHTGEPGGRVVWLYRRRELHRSESWEVEGELTVSIPGEQIKPYLEALVTVEGVDVAPSDIEKPDTTKVIFQLELITDTDSRIYLQLFQNQDRWWVEKDDSTYFLLSQEEADKLLSILKYVSTILPVSQEPSGTE